jgi:hypothetical protein
VFDGQPQSGAAGRMTETRKVAAILVSDVIGYSRRVGDLVDPNPL